MEVQKNSENIDPKVLKTRDGEINLSKRVRCGSKRSGFMKKEEANRLSDLGITKPLGKCPLLR